MSYKSEFQSNNADLETIITTVDNLPNPVNVDSELDTQANLLSQIQTALNGKGINKSGGLTLDNIGIFTFSLAPEFRFLFVKGMTFGEWLNSNMNVEFIDCFDGHDTTVAFKNTDGGIGSQDVTRYDVVNITRNSIPMLSLDGTVKSMVTLDTLIQEREYLYFESFLFCGVFGIDIDGSITYYLRDEDSMTWAEWCNSKYNTDGWSVDGLSVVNNAIDRMLIDASSNDDITRGKIYKAWER